MNIDFPKIEKEILRFWEEKKIFEKLRKKNQGKKRWSFLDGPITANNPMGVHHAWGRTYKDLFQRYKAMQGFEQRFQNGFDCQGLWVEVEVEKELGFKTKKDIEKFGIEKFVEKCKERVWKYSKVQTEQSIRLGQWMDWENSYYTMSDENNYAIWGFLKKCWQKGFLYKGRDVVPWCWRCGTAISQHEILTEEYQEVSHKVIFFKLPVIGGKNTYFLVWTTTPWTLPANVAIAVHPDFQYAFIKDKESNIFILLEEKAYLIPEGKIIKTVLGKELKDLKYKGLFDELPAVQESLQSYEHSVIFWEDVSKEEGTGIVHIAPGCGQEDFQLSKSVNIPAIDPVDDESRYKDGFSILTGKLVAEVNDLIFEDLSKKNLVFKIENYLHRYPTCWRCKTELIFRLVDEWYVSMEKLRKPLMEISKKIKWIPSFGLERELDWLKNMQDWLISKKRYWGLSLPIFECSCGNFEVIGSKEELKEKAVEGWNNFEGHSPHRPWVDEVKIKCSKCGKLVSRVLDVGSPWLDAGIVSFSTMKYFSDKKYWKEWFPADLVCESFPGQFKNWFYSLIVMSTVLEDINPTKAIFGYALVRDEKGEEMHKSKANVIWFDEAVEKIGADVMRWMYARQNPVYNLNFSYTAAEEIKRKILTLYNVFCFFNTYIEKQEIPKDDLKSGIKNILDRWIVSRFNNLIQEVARSMDEYNVMAAVLLIEDFFINDLSLWYLRRSRKRFHTGNEERQDAISTLYYVLLNLIRVMAPIMPFFAEEMYSNIKAEKMPESIHLHDWPKTDKEKIDLKLESDMGKTREIVTLSLAERSVSKIRVRQPLPRLEVKSENLGEDFKAIIRDEINVKEIVFNKTLEGPIKLDTKITPELKEEGIVREIIRQLQDMRKKAGFSPKDQISVQYFGTPELNRTLEEKRAFILKEAKVKNLILEEKSSQNFGSEKEIKVDEQKIWLGINKV